MASLFFISRTPMVLNKFLVAMLVVFAFINQLKAQDTYVHKYLEGNLSKGGSELLIEYFNDGVICVFGAYPEQNEYHSQSIMVSFFDLTGKLIWTKQHRFNFPVKPEESLAINDTLYIAGVRGVGGNGNPDNTVFLAVINAQGALVNYNEVRIASSLSVLSELVFERDSNEIVLTALTSPADFGSNHQVLVRFSQQGNVKSVRQIMESYTSTNYLTTNSGKRFLKEQNKLIALNGNDVPVDVKDMIDTAGKEFRPFKFLKLPNDTFLLLNVHASSNEVSTAFSMWNSKSNLISSYLKINGVLPIKFLRTNTGYILNARAYNPDHYCVYEFDKEFNTKRSGRIEGVQGFYSSFNALPICGDKLLAFQLSGDTNLLYTYKTDSTWRISKTDSACPVPFKYNNTIQLKPGTGVFNYSEIGVNTKAQSISSKSDSLIATVISADTNCKLIRFSSDSLLFCNSNGEVLTPIETARTCLPDGTVRKYNWGFGESSSSLVVNKTGWYKLRVNEDICQVEDSVYANFEKISVAIYGDSVFCGELFETSVLKVNSNATKLLWRPIPNSDTTYVTKQEGMVKVTAISDLGCITSDSTYVNELCEPLIYVPNAFSPDGDGYNELLIASLKFVDNVLFSIYNRFGQLVFQTINPQLNWNGMYKGNFCPNDVYVWQLSYKPEQNEQTAYKKGSVLLIK